MSILSILIALLHSLAAALWVGGMFFAYVMLRPAMATLDAPPDRLRLWAAVFGRFFPWVWLFVVVLPVTGYIATFTHFGGFATAALHVPIMHGLGWLMIGLYIILQMGPYKRYRAAVTAQNWPLAGQHLAGIRRIVGANTILGLLTIAIGASGRYWHG